MPIYAKTLYDYIKSGKYGRAYIVDDRIRDKEFRKKLIREFFLEIINAIEYCISDTVRMISDKDYKIYREREYDTSFIYPDGKGGFVFKEGGIWVEDKVRGYSFQDGGVLGDIRLEERIYYNKTIKDIYILNHLELMELYNIYSMEYPLSFSELVFPAKMPTKDYFPFADFDLGTKITLPLTDAEKRECEEADDPQDCLEMKSNLEITKFDWCYCILWIDKDRMYMNLDCNNYYFKQVGKDTHFFELTYKCT